MEFVCFDHNGNSTWNYDSENKSYHREMESGETRMIKGEYLPDPFLLFENRRNQVKNINPNITEAELSVLCMPQEATYKLWEHWQNVNNHNQL